MPAMDNKLLLLGKRIRELREKAGRTQESVAAAAGMNVSYFSQVETGKANLTYLNLLAIAAALFVNPADLLENEHLHGEEQIKAQAADMLSQLAPEHLRMMHRLLRIITR